MLPAHVADDPDLRQRFEREAKTISSLNHPHICTLYDIGSQDGIDFLVMEYLEGDVGLAYFEAVGGAMRGLTAHAGARRPTYEGLNGLRSP